MVYIGDDDGLLPNAILRASQILSQTGVNVLNTRTATYCWPNFAVMSRQNTLGLPLTNRLLKIASAKFLRLAENIIFDPCLIPMAYNSFLEIGLFEALKRKTGRVFWSSVPDYYSGSAIPSVAGQWLSLTRPLIIRGLSAHSIGTSASVTVGNHEAARQFISENDSHPWHPKLKLVLGLSILGLAEPLLQANDHCYGGALRINMRRLLRLTFKAMASLDASRHEEASEQVMSIARENGAEALRHFS